MKRSRFLTLSALYIATYGAIASEDPQSEGKVARTTLPAAANAESAASSRLINEFAALAGSEDNARKLIAGLHNAKPVALPTAAATAQEVSFAPPPRPMSLPDIHKALSLAQAQLKSKNIANPEPAHLRTALAGGELPNAEGEMTRVIGILPLHRRGMTWAQIARALRVSLPKDSGGKS